MASHSFFRHLIQPTKGTFAQLVRYAFSGGLAFAVDFGLLWFVTDICHAHYLVGAFCGYTAGLIITYLLSINWIFPERRFTNTTAEFTIFTVIGLCGLLITQGLMYVFTEYLFTLQRFGAEHYLFSKLLTTVIVSLFNFFMKKFLLFTRKK
jgi:putative flippase GtrA